jgi:hypothetical protein
MTQVTPLHSELSRRVSAVARPVVAAACTCMRGAVVEADDPGEIRIDPLACL